MITILNRQAHWILAVLAVVLLGFPDISKAQGGQLTVNLTGQVQVWGQGTATITSSPAGIDTMVSCSTILSQSPLILQTGTKTISLAGPQTVTLTASAPAGTSINWGTSSCPSTATTCSQMVTPPYTWTISVNSSPYLGWWKFDDVSGIWTADSSGAGHSGLVVGPTWATNGIMGGALQFNGHGQYVSLGNVLTQNNTSFSISAWVKVNAVNAATQQVIMAAGNSPASGMLGLFMDPNGKSIDFGYLGTGGNSYATSMANVQDGQWHHVVGEMEAYTSNGESRIQYFIYVDGYMDRPANFSASPFPAGGWMVGSNIGNSGAGSGTMGFNGLIDDVRIYNQLLHSAEVLDLYEQAIPPVTLSLGLHGYSKALYMGNGFSCSYSGTSETGTCSVSIPPTKQISLTAAFISPAGSTFNWGVSGPAVVSGCTSTSNNCTVINAQAVEPTWNISVYPPISQDGSFMYPPGAPTSGMSYLETSAGYWQFGTATDSYGTQINLNQTSAANGYAAMLLVYNGGTMYAQSLQSDWYQYNAANSTWTQVSGDPRPSVPTITSQPQNVMVWESNSAIFSITASGNPSPAYQWQQSTDGGNTWANIGGAQSASYTIASATASAEFRCVATNTGGSATSNAATLTVVSTPSASGTKMYEPTYPGGPPAGNPTYLALNGIWQFGTATDSYGTQINLNQTSAANGYAAMLLVYNSNMYAQDAYGHWWHWQASSWIAATDPRGP